MRTNLRYAHAFDWPYAVVASYTIYLEWAVSFTGSYTQTSLKLLALKKKKTSRPPKGFCKPGELLFPWIWPFSNLIFLQFYFILFYSHRWSNIEDDDDDDLGLLINDESKLNSMLRLFFIWMSILKVCLRVWLIVFQSSFRIKIYYNNIFFNYHIKTIQIILKILIFYKKKTIFLWNAIFPNYAYLEKEPKPCKQGTKTTNLEKLWFTLN